MPTGAGNLPGLTEDDVVLRSKLREARDYAANEAKKYDNAVNDAERSLRVAYRSIAEVLGKAL
ncbi:hypothetical protein ABZ990_25570 [Streptomyces sp. NPDC046203]|uniref:hypothetical protein n=1 Tax=Streptomyces sp. NPDC046203 TaxID=3154602 RepID=UPI0033F9EEE3